MQADTKALLYVRSEHSESVSRNSELPLPAVVRLTRNQVAVLSAHCLVAGMWWLSVTGGEVRDSGNQGDCIASRA